MKKLYLALSMGLFVSLYSQTVLPSGLQGLSTENYVFARTYLDYDTITNQPTKVAESVTYYDGLGRPKQSISIKASPTGKDIVTTIPYDGFGRQVDSWLPVPMSSLNGGIQSGVETAAVGFYNNDPKPFARKKLENSPLDRIDSLFQVGSAWSDHPVVFDYGTNKNEVKNYTATFNYTTFTSTLTLNGQRPANTLYKNTVNDEDGNTSIEYKNGEGQTILIRKLVGFKNAQGIAAPMAPIDNNIYADTYYVYNDYNQLSFVIPPLAVATGNISTATKDDLCYQYIYDGRNRLVEKKLPGKGWEYMVYDNQDRLVMTQDAHMGTDQKWLFTKYDQFGRVAYTGIYVSDEIYDRTGRNYEQEEVNGKGSNNVARTISAGFTAPGLIVYYDNLSANNYPNTITEILSVNYYDTYPPHSPTIPATILSQPVLGKPSTTSNISTKGLPTASFVKNIENASWTKNYTYYDQKGRPIFSHSINHLGGYTKVESKLDFSGVPQKTITYQSRKNVTTPSVKIEENFTYDNQNRLIKHEHIVNNGNIEILAENTYNDIGQLVKKKVGNNIQEINYNYNIRGWMTGINLDGNGGFQTGKLFNYKINYNNLLEGMELPNQEYTTPIVPKWNGNIAEVLWKNHDDPNVKRYGYVYDNMNRLLAGLYQSSLNLSSQEHAE
ncbi:MAG: DUF6443 domain-containing protein, partial [Flavobacteriales bacterium]|nr:DUF6443 domain-containing protein [Flavobacteriales bacterium]